MAIPTNREQLKDWCLRQLGFPVLEINVDDEQVEDAIDLAFQYFRDFHVDGVERTYLKHLITNEDIANRYITISNDIIGVTRIFPISDSVNTVNMFDLRYQLRLNELYDFTSASYINYTLTMQHLRSLEQMFTGEVPIRFQRHMQRLYIDWSWKNGNEITAGQVVIAEAYAVIDPNVYNRVWSDRWLKEYATALIKRSWGANMSKFDSIQLPGGVTLNGEKIYKEATDEIERLETEMSSNFFAPLEFFMN